MSKFVLPYEPQYTGHRDAKSQQKDARDRQRRQRRETELCGTESREAGSPALVPEPVRENHRTK